MPAPFLKNSYCSYCGAANALDQPWPRTCANCDAISYANPLPVAVLLLPVDDGVLVVRRAIPPRQGQLALPGGFIDQSESWQAAAVRELREEAGIVVNPTEVRLFDALSASDGTLLIFGIALPRRASELPAFAASAEVSERRVLAQPEPLAFALHTVVVERWFAERPSGGDPAQREAPASTSTAGQPPGSPARPTLS
jgi:ADP-ribose pyrophosphatase YjhB (NUDIX family)